MRIILMNATMSAWLFLSISPIAQSGPATTSPTSKCNVANTGNQNTITITCGIDTKQAQQVLVILNRILAGQLDTKAVMRKLDELQRPNETFTSGSSSPIVSGNGNTVTYNNLSPEDATTEQKKDIRITLAGFMSKGETLRARCFTDSSTNELEEAIDDWVQEVSLWLAAHLDASFVVQFNHLQISAINPMGMSRDRLPIFRKVDQRVETLNNFMDRFR
jgi:hypothetical protein